MPPERVRAWLEGLDVEGRDLGDYDEWSDEALDEAATLEQGTIAFLAGAGRT